MTLPNTEGKGWLSIPIVGVAATTGGAVASVANPEGAPVLITRSILYVATNSAGAANLTAGIAADGVTAATNILTALAMAAAAGKVFNGNAIITATATELTAPGVWGATQFLTVQGSASTVGLTGTLYVEYLRV